MTIPIEQHYTRINGDFILTSKKEIEVSDKVFAETMADLIAKSFAK